MINNINCYNPDITVWELTLKCNLNCLHCGSSAGNNRINELSTKESLNLCEDLSNLNCKGIALMGGEVFLRDDWYTISKKIKDLGMTLSIITNGFVDNEKIVNRLLKLDVDCIMVGLDAASENLHDQIRNKKGSFKKSLSFLRALNENNLKSGIITTVHKLNFNELQKIKEFVSHEKINWQIQCATPIGRFPKNLILSDKQYYALGLFIQSLKNSFKKSDIIITGAHNFGFNSSIISNLSFYPKWNGCYAGKSVLGIQSNGNVKGCLALSDDFIEGNIRQENIIDIWNRKKSFSYSRNFDLKNLGENCQGCKFLQDCKGGCTTKSVSITGVPNNDPYCFFRIEKEGFL